MITTLVTEILTKRLTKEMAFNIQEVFERADKDGDGIVTKAELAAAGMGGKGGAAEVGKNHAVKMTAEMKETKVAVNTETKVVVKKKEGKVAVKVD